MAALFREGNRRGAYRGHAPAPASRRRPQHGVRLQSDRVQRGGGRGGGGLHSRRNRANAGAEGGLDDRAMHGEDDRARIPRRDGGGPREMARSGRCRHRGVHGQRLEDRDPRRAPGREGRIRNALRDRSRSLQAHHRGAAMLPPQAWALGLSRRRGGADALHGQPPGGADKELPGRDDRHPMRDRATPSRPRRPASRSWR